MREWVDKIPSVEGGFISVVKEDKGIRSGKVDLNKPLVGVAHTTEGWALPGYSPGVAPQFDVGPRAKGGKILLRQLVPLGWMGTALRNPSGGVETNRWALVQLEQCAFSSLDPWLPATEDQRIITASLFEFCEKELGIPEKRPFDDVLDKGTTWATSSNPRRRAGKWGKEAGWFNHCEVPENDHWDCGSEKLRVLLGIEPKDAVPTVRAYQVVAAWEEGEGHKHRSVELSPNFAQRRDIRAWLVKEGAIRGKVWKHLALRHKIHIAEREVAKTHVR